MEPAAIASNVSKFIRTNFLFNEQAKLNEQESLLGAGVIDSTGILELICYLEETYNLKFEDDELVADNVDSIERISNFIAKKTA